MNGYSALENFDIPSEILGVIKALYKKNQILRRNRRSQIKSGKTEHRDQARMPTITISIHHGDGQNI